MHNVSIPGKTVPISAVTRWPASKFLILAFFFLLPYSLCLATYMTYYVSPEGGGDGSTYGSPTLFQTALDGAHSVDSVYINVLSGTYDLSQATLVFRSDDNETVKIMIRGGYDTNGNITEDPALTVLDGKELKQIMRLSAKALNADLTVKISNISFINGYSTDDGDAETVDSGAALSAHAGNSSLYGSFHLSVSDCIFEDNLTVNYGGAIYSNVVFCITDCVFSRNIASNGGALFAAVGPDVDQTIESFLDACEFNQNKNTGNQGSSIWHNVTLSVTDCRFYGMEDGSLVGPGSCIWGNEGSTHVISRCLFKDIKVKYWGSAIQSFGGNAYIDNCVFTGCKAGEEYGTGDGYGTIAFYHNNQPATVKRIANCTFVGNRSRFSTSTGGAIHNRGLIADDFLVSNCVFYDNGTLPLYSTGTLCGLQYSCITTTYSGFADIAGNTSQEPAFGDEFFHLSEGSPCYNKGLNTAEPLSDYDLDGHRRILGDAIDMGAYELNHAPYGLALSDTVLPENAGADHVIGTLSASDDDVQDLVDLEFYLMEGDGSNDADNGYFYIDGDQLLVNSDADFEEDDEWDILVGVSDFSGLNDEKAFRIKITDQNDPVVVNGSIPDQDVIIGEMYSYTLEDDLFTDQDGDMLDIGVTLADESALPAWLSYNKASQTLEGNTAAELPGVLDLLVSATDDKGSLVSTGFKLTLAYNTGLDKDPAEKLWLYPNPAGDFLIISVECAVGPTIFFLYGADGRLLIQKEFMGSEYRLITSEFEPGLYIIYINSDSGNFPARFIKE